MTKPRTAVIYGIEIRNLRRVPATGYSKEGYSFTFEAFRGDGWIEYGPQCYGNWSVASYIKREPVLPTPSIDDPSKSTIETVYIGWQALRRAFEGGDPPTPPSLWEHLTER